MNRKREDLKRIHFLHEFENIDSTYNLIYYYTYYVFIK